MKKCLIFYIFCLFIINAFGQVYIYNINPQNKEWKEFKTEEERLLALQIPIYILNNISKDDLIISCINFPAFGHYTAFNSNQKGFDYVYKNFNGLQELFNREDAGEKVLNIYSKLSIYNFQINKFGIDTTFTTIRYNFFELIIAQEKIIKQLSNEQKTKLIEIALQNYKNKLNSKSFNSLICITPTVLIIGRTLNILKPNIFDKKEYILNFLITSELFDANLLEIIIKEAINNQKL